MCVKLVISGMDVLLSLSLSLSLRLFLSVSKDTTFEGFKNIRTYDGQRDEEEGPEKHWRSVVAVPPSTPPSFHINALANDSKTGFTAFLSTRYRPRVSKDSTCRKTTTANLHRGFLVVSVWKMYQLSDTVCTVSAQKKVTMAHLSFAALLVVVVA